MRNAIQIECCGEQVPNMQSERVGNWDLVGGGYQPTESTNIKVMDEVATIGASGTDVAVPVHVFNNPLEQATWRKWGFHTLPSLGKLVYMLQFS